MTTSSRTLIIAVLLICAAIALAYVLPEMGGLRTVIVTVLGVGSPYFAAKLSGAE